mmetsp:Transcript_24313/g.33355  ORF Transcript_24313/g.33355 Transcript_24313/m.33355 type:complete len:99 (+) Transcript_24313:210-506(+)
MASWVRLAVLAKEPAWMDTSDVGRDTDISDLELLKAALSMDDTDVGIEIETNPEDENISTGMLVIVLGMETTVRDVQWEKAAEWTKDTLVGMKILCKL